MQSVSSSSLIAIFSSTKQISRPHQHLCESRYSDSRISTIFIHGNGFFFHNSFSLAFMQSIIITSSLLKFFRKISHPRKEIFFNYERLLIINIRAIIIIVGNSFLAKAHKSFIHKMDFSFPKILFVMNIRGIIVHLCGSHLLLFLSPVYRKCFIHQTDLSFMSACLSITLSCGKVFIHENRFIIHKSFSLLFGAVAIFSSKKPIYHPQELFLLFTRGLWKKLHPQNRFVIYESLFFFSFGLWKIRVKFVWSFRAVIGIAVVFLVLPSHRRPCFAPLPRTVCASLLSLRLSFRQPFPSTSCDISSPSQ